ncbi:uncharacterized protein [Salvelinus sp. IW2-2015]|uniref:uncharacterized protein n=1 Tax=Salvelinus sp. IW2-2015 TaxID=2691554 RepID=UPI000CDF7C60|nr:uncharacterized protein LOC111954455 [Salvelinus alpinus]
MMAASLGISIALSLLYLGVLGSPKGYSIPEGVAIQSECRDRYLWVHVGWSGNAPQFEAVDAAGVHPIDEKNASRCGYTISTFKMDGYTTLRASYFSCHIDNQNDEVFTFQFNIIVMDAKDRQSCYPLSQTCSLLLPWSQREVICEEDYMEVTVGRDVPCTTSEGTSKEAWRAAHSVAQNIANSAWQVMFLKDEDEMATMPITEARRLGYELSATPKRVVFRSPYRQNHSEIIMVDGVAVEVIHGTVFFSQKMMVVMIDISVACTINPGYFDGVRLLWETPRIMTPLVHSGFGFESKQINVGVESQLLDEGTARARGYTLEVKGLMVQMGVPFGAEGGYRKSLVTNNIYREMYVAFLFYEHVFSHVYTDGSTVETRHRLLRVVDTPLLCRHPFTIDVDALPPYHKTSFEEHTFNVYLGNIPHDVALMGVKLNEKQFSVSDAAEHGYTISKIVHANGTHAYTIRVPFDDKAVHRTYLGEGLFQYSMDMNYTLSIMPQEEAYYHLASVMEQLSNAFPPELKGVCTRGGIVFDMTQPRLGYLWEIGVGHDPLTPELVAERGYNLRNESHILTLEVPLFTVGYTYEDINLRHFYGIFEIHSRDSRTLEIQTATATRCLFRRDQLIICSTDGIMTVVTSTKTTWPAVNPRSTTLLDRTCKPKLMDDSRVLFEFGLNTCNTTVMVEDSSVVYENEILSYSELILDSASFIARHSKFRLTVRCLYPLSSVSRLFVDKTFKSEMPGVGSIKFTGSNKDGAANKPEPDCPQQVPTNTESVQVIGTQPSPSNHEVLQTGGLYSTNYGSLTVDNTLDPSLGHYSGLQRSGAPQSSSNVQSVLNRYGLVQGGSAYGTGQHKLSDNDTPAINVYESTQDVNTPHQKGMGIRPETDRGSRLGGYGQFPIHSPVQGDGIKDIPGHYRPTSAKMINAQSSILNPVPSHIISTPGGSTQNAQQHLRPHPNYESKRPSNSAQHEMYNAVQSAKLHKPATSHHATVQTVNNKPTLSDTTAQSGSTSQHSGGNVLSGLGRYSQYGVLQSSDGISIPQQYVKPASEQYTPDNVKTPRHYDTPSKVNPFLASYVYQNTEVQPGSNYNTDAQRFGVKQVLPANVHGSSQVSNSFQQVPSHKVPLGDRAQGTSSYVKPASRDNFVVQGVDHQPTTSKVPAYSTYGDSQSGLSQVPGHDSLGHDETSFGEMKPTKAQLAPIKMLVPSQLSVNKYGPSKGQYVKPASGHYGSSVGRTEIVYSGAKHNTDYHNTAQGTVYQASDNVQSTPHGHQPSQMGTITQPNPSNTKPVHSGISQSHKLHNSAASSFYGTSQDKNYVPVASEYDASKSNHVQPASNQYVGTQTSIVTPGPYSVTLQKLATSLHAASQPHVQPTTSRYGAAQHIAIKLALSQHQVSQSDRVKPATSKYVTLQHHSIQQVPGQDVSQSSSAKPATSTSQSVPSQYDGSQSSRVAQAPIGTIPFQQNIIHHTSNQDRGPQSVRVEPTPKSAPTQSNINQQSTGQYGGSRSYRVEPAPQQIRIQPATSGIREPSPGQSASSHLNIDQQATSAYRGSQSHRRTPAPSKYGASTVQYAAKGHERNLLAVISGSNVDTDGSDPCVECSLGNSGGNSNFIKVSSGGQPMVSQDTGAQDNPSCVSPIYCLFNQGSAQSGRAQSVEKQQDFSQSHTVQDPPSHFQPTSQAGKINGQPDPIHGTTSNFHQPVQHGGHLQALNRGETTLGHHGSAQLTSAQLSPSQVKPTSSRYSKYQDGFSKNAYGAVQSANGAYENTQGGNGQPNRRQHGSPLSFYRAVQVSAKKPLSMTSVQSPRYGVVQTGNIQRDRNPNTRSQYDANCLGCGQTLSDHHGYLSSLKGTQGGAENNPNNLNYISTEKEKVTNLPKVISGNYIDAEGSHENCPDNSGPRSNNPLNTRSSDPGRYGGSVHEGILRGKRG